MKSFILATMMTIMLGGIGMAQTPTVHESSAQANSKHKHEAKKQHHKTHHAKSQAAPKQ